MFRGKSIIVVFLFLVAGCGDGGHQHYAGTPTSEDTWRARLLFDAHNGKWTVEVEAQKTLRDGLTEIRSAINDNEEREIIIFYSHTERKIYLNRLPILQNARTRQDIHIPAIDFRKIEEDRYTAVFSSDIDLGKLDPSVAEYQKRGQ